MRNLKLKSHFLYTFLVAVLLIGCKNENITTNFEEKTERNILKISRQNWLHIAEVDSCEYIVFDGYKKGGIIHKQNCKFCLARSTK